MSAALLEISQKLGIPVKPIRNQLIGITPE